SSLHDILACSLPSRHCLAPRPPLFPYTTLFRSAAAQVRELLADLVAGGVARLAAGHQGGAGLEHERLHLVPRDVENGRDLDVPRDRKSTRLNSSHQIISYAVFCLTKKNVTIKKC